MGAQSLLYFPCRNLVTSGLDDVAAPAANDAVASVLYDRHVTRGEPAIVKRFLGLFGLAPVFAEYASATNLDLSRRARIHQVSVLVYQPHLDTGNGSAHVSGNALSAEGIGQPHADFGHPIPLQQRVSTYLPPAFQ